MGVTLPSPRSADTPLAPLPPVSVPTVADQVWRMWQHPDFHIRAMMNPSLEISGTCIPYLSFCSPGLDGRIVTAGSLSGFSRSEDHTGLRSDFLWWWMYGAFLLKFCYWSLPEVMERMSPQ